MVNESHEALAVDDKALEKGFRREFQDALEYMDVLLKLYRQPATFKHLPPKRTRPATRGPES